MSGMVERVRDIIAPGRSCPYACEDLGKCLCADVARAAIEAMREPTEAMVMVRYNPQEAEDYWQMMIDAALAEPARAEAPADPVG